MNCYGTLKCVSYSYVDVQSIEDFKTKIPKFELIKNNYISIYFYKKECLSFYIVYTFCQNADEFSIIPNKFSDDKETTNYCAKFHKNRIQDIAFLHYCLNTRGLAQKAYFGNLYNSKVKNSNCAGSAIYNIPYADYFKGLDWIINIKGLYSATENQKKNFKELVKIVYSNYKLPVNFDELPRDFMENLVFEDIF